MRRSTFRAVPVRFQCTIGCNRSSALPDILKYRLQMQALQVMQLMQVTLLAKPLRIFVRAGVVWCGVGTLAVALGVGW